MSQTDDLRRRPEGPAKTYIYSADGVYFAYTIPGRYVYIIIRRQRKNVPCS